MADYLPQASTGQTRQGHEANTLVVKGLVDLRGRAGRGGDPGRIRALVCHERFLAARRQAWRHLRRQRFRMTPLRFPLLDFRPNPPPTCQLRAAELQSFERIWMGRPKGRDCPYTH